MPVILPAISGYILWMRGNKTFAQHLLLILRGSRGQHGSSQRLLAVDNDSLLLHANSRGNVRCQSSTLLVGRVAHSRCELESGTGLGKNWGAGRHSHRAAPM